MLMLLIIKQLGIELMDVCKIEFQVENRDLSPFYPCFWNPRFLY